MSCSERVSLHLTLPELWWVDFYNRQIIKGYTHLNSPFTNKERKQNATSCLNLLSPTTHTSWGLSENSTSAQSAVNLTKLIHHAPVRIACILSLLWKCRDLLLFGNLLCIKALFHQYAFNSPFSTFQTFLGCLLPGTELGTGYLGLNVSAVCISFLKCWNNLLTRVPSLFCSSLSSMGTLEPLIKHWNHGSPPVTAKIATLQPSLTHRAFILLIHFYKHLFSTQDTAGILYKVLGDIAVIKMGNDLLSQ